MSSNVNLKFTSWNVRGMVKLAKMKQVLRRVKQINSSVVYFQETHLLSDEVIKIKRDGQDRSFQPPTCHTLEE